MDKRGMEECLDNTVEAAVHAIFEDGGLTAACFGGLGESELRFVNSADHGGGAAHVYGDTDVALVRFLFEVMCSPISSDSVFADLGSGSGKLTLSVLLLAHAQRAVGVELSPTRHSQALVAEAAARARGLLDGALQQQPSNGPAPLLEWFCGSMLDHDLAGCNRVFCCALAVFASALAAHHVNSSSPYRVRVARELSDSLCLDDAFLVRLRSHLAARLPCGAAVLLRGRPFPDTAEDKDSPPPCHAALAPVLETAIVNREYQYFGYVVSHAAGASSSRETRRLELEQRVTRLGGVERAAFAVPEPDEEAPLWELLDGDGER